jgi:transposase
MGRPEGWMKQLTGRGPMRSPGAPSLRREVERQFWVEIAIGITSEKAADAVGVSQAVGSRWFRHRGGMPLFMSKPVSDRYLSFAEREDIGILRAQDLGVREIARHIGRSPSTVSRELTRNAATRGGKLEYRASVAQWKSELLARRPKPAKLVTNSRLREYVQERLEGSIHDARGREVSGPRQHRSLAATNLTAAIASGSMAGRPSRLPTDCGSTSPMILQCASRTKPSTRPCTSRAAAPSSASL